MSRRVKFECCRRGGIGITLTIVTRDWRRSLWIDWPRLSKLDRWPSKPGRPGEFLGQYSIPLWQRGHRWVWDGTDWVKLEDAG